MNKASKSTSHRLKSIWAVLSLAACLHAPYGSAAEKPTFLATQPVPLEDRTKFKYDTYILGPGDVVEIELVDIPELSGQFSIGPDGTLFLPRLRAVYVEGLTVEELQVFLTDQFRSYVIDPQLYLRPIAYRPIRVYVGGEVKRPGYYTLSGNHNIASGYSQLSQNADFNQLNEANLKELVQTSSNINKFNFSVLPTVFDAIQSAQGITPYSDLSVVKVTRRQPASRGSGRIQAQLDFLSLITEGNESQNIRLLDGDVINVSKSPTVLRDQLIQAGQTNLTPEFMRVFVTGRVEQMGAVTLPQGSTLVHAIDVAGGTKVIHGRVEFIRFNRDGEIDRRVFPLKTDTPSGNYRNPVLMAGDVIRVRETPLTKTTAVINEITSPVVGLYSLYSIFDLIGN